MTFTKIDPADLDSSRRELPNGGLKSVVTLLVHWQINFLSAHIGRPIQLIAFVRAVLASLSDACTLGVRLSPR